MACMPGWNFLEQRVFSELSKNRDSNPILMGVGGVVGMGMRHRRLKTGTLAAGCRSDNA
jgi:hypothetical protein